MTRGDGTTYDTDAHVEWGYVIDDWPTDGVTSFIAVESEFSARNLTSQRTGGQPMRLAKRTVGDAQETT